MASICSVSFREHQTSSTETIHSNAIASHSPVKRVFLLFAILELDLLQRLMQVKPSELGLVSSTLINPLRSFSRHRKRRFLAARIHFPPSHHSSEYRVYSMPNSLIALTRAQNPLCPNVSAFNSSKKRKKDHQSSLPRTRGNCQPNFRRLPLTYSTPP